MMTAFSTLKSAAILLNFLMALRILVVIVQNHRRHSHYGGPFEVGEWADRWAVKPKFIGSVYSCVDVNNFV